jgi:hypothetical protein
VAASTFPATADTRRGFALCLDSKYGGQNSPRKNAKSAESFALISNTGGAEFNTKVTKIAKSFALIPNAGDKIAPER